MCGTFVNISYFDLKFLLSYTFEICKKINFLKPEHETTSLMIPQNNLPPPPPPPRQLKNTDLFFLSFLRPKLISLFFFACSRAVGDRATEPRVAPHKLQSSEEDLKEMHLKKIKPKAEPTKPILQSLREGIEHLKKTTVREKSTTRQNSSNGFLDRISKLAQGSRSSRNPAKKSASFTFASRPQMIVKTKERYSSLEPETTSQSHSNQTKQPVQRSISTSVLETPAQIELQPNYSRVHDSLVPLPPPPVVSTRSKADDIYAEICETTAATKIHECPGSHVIARIKIIVKSNESYRDDEENKKVNDKYVSSVFTNQQMDSIINTEDDVIYNTIF